MRLDSKAWRLWAYVCRSGYSLGYPTRQPFYTPPQLGNTYTSSSPPTDNEITFAEMIGESVSALHAARQFHAEVLKQFHGAYPDAPHKAERIKRLHIDRSTAYRLANEGELWCEGHLSALVCRD